MGAGSGSGSCIAPFVRASASGSCGCPGCPSMRLLKAPHCCVSPEGAPGQERMVAQLELGRARLRRHGSALDV